MKDAIKPVVSARKTTKLLANQGYTYNRAGLTYNEIGLIYGGVYGYDVVPSVALSYVTTPSASIRSIKPTVQVNKTQKQLEDQGYTYNEAGLTYNQIGVMYGGVYNYDVMPLVSLARSQKPMNIIGMNFASTVIPPTPTGNSGYLIGMLGMTYP